MAGDDPFNPDQADEETELTALARALALAEGFKLLFVRCNSEALRRRLIRALKKRLPRHPLKEVRLGRPIEHLLDELRQRPPARETGSVHVSGLERSLPESSAALSSSAPVVANLNAARNSFPEGVGCPLVLWVPEYVLTAIARGAPDFFSIRSGIYYFDGREEAAEAPGLPSRVGDEDWAGVRNLSRGEKEERIAAIQSLLQEADHRGPDPRSRRSRGYLLERIAALHYALGRWSDAHQAYQEQMEIAEALGDRDDLAVIYHQLGMLAQDRGSLDEAEAWYRKSLEINEALADRAGLASTYHQLGRLAQDRGSLEEAETWYRKSLEIKEALADRAGLASTYHQLGRLAQDRGSLEEAETWYRKSLGISEALGDRASLASTYHQLGMLAQDRGSLEEAETWYRKSLEIKEALGNRAELAITCGQMGLLAEAKRRHAQALDWTVRCLSLLPGDARPTIEQALGQLARLTRRRGMAALERSWQRQTGQPLPAAIREQIARLIEQDRARKRT
jgi:tetratricopeptide (TPR) repeat protein